jgi:predicted DNA-binding transcriptional regulator YafY
MKRFDRLLSILLLIQHMKRVRAEDLAGRFGVTKRTIYRDMAALNEAGVPIISLPGEGYELAEGYFLPPLVFADREAVTLYLGARLLCQQASGTFAADAEQALAKLEVALPSRTRQRVAELAGIISFIAPAQRFNLDDPMLVTLQRAIQQQRVVHLRYHSLRRNELTERDLEPHQLYYSDGVWYVEGYCRLRRGPRAFRLSRIERLDLRPEKFKRRAAPRPPAAVTRVAVRFEPNVLRWVRERQHYAFEREAPLPDRPGALMTYAVNDFLEIRAWLLGWGASAEVLSPPALRESLRQEAQRLAEMLT